MTQVEQPGGPLPSSIVVLGASEPFGSQVALQLALSGRKVIAVGKNAATLARTKREAYDACASLAVVVCAGAFRALEDDLAALGGLSGSAVVRILDEYDDAATASAFMALQRTARTERVAGRGSGRLDAIISVAPLGAQGAREGQGTPSVGAHFGGAVIYMEMPTEGRTKCEMVTRLSVSQLVGVRPGVVAGLIVDLIGERKVAADVLLRVRGDELLAFRRGAHSGNGAGAWRFERRLGSAHCAYVAATSVGRGVFAARDFTLGELVLESSGQVLRHQTEHSLQIGWQMHLEPDAPIRFINHSCDPNLGVRTNARGLPDFIARRDIAAGEQLAFDYAMTEFVHEQRRDPTYEFELTCRCGSSRCRGRLGYFFDLPEELKEEYRGFVSNYLQDSAGAAQGQTKGRMVLP